MGEREGGKLKRKKFKSTMPSNLGGGRLIFFQLHNHNYFQQINSIRQFQWPCTSFSEMYEYYYDIIITYSEHDFHGTYNKVFEITLELNFRK